MKPKYLICIVSLAIASSVEASVLDQDGNLLGKPSYTFTGKRVAATKGVITGTQLETATPTRAATTDITVIDGCELTVAGGSLDSVTVKEGSADLTGGTVTSLELLGSSKGFLNGGAVKTSANVRGNSTFTVNTGSISSLAAFDSATLNINGGTFGSIVGVSKSILNFNDGLVTEGIKFTGESRGFFYGGIAGDLSISGDAQFDIFALSGIGKVTSTSSQALNIYGSDLKFEGENLTGKDASGKSFNVAYVGDRELVKFETVPEPSSALLLGLAGAMTIVRRRR